MYYPESLKFNTYCLLQIFPCNTMRPFLLCPRYTHSKLLNPRYEHSINLINQKSYSKRSSSFMKQSFSLALTIQSATKLILLFSIKLHAFSVSLSSLKYLLKYTLIDILKVLFSFISLTLYSVV